MESINELAQVISTVGFPIACCGYLLWQNGKQDNYHREEQAKLRAQYIADLRASLRGNLESIKIQNPDGTMIDVKERHDKKFGGKH